MRVKSNTESVLLQPLSGEMLCKFDLNDFWTKRVAARQQSANGRLREAASILTELLRVEWKLAETVLTLNTL